jgi:hypothetical protein
VLGWSAPSIECSATADAVPMDGWTISGSPDDLLTDFAADRRRLR